MRNDPKYNADNESRRVREWREDGKTVIVVYPPIMSGNVWSGNYYYVYPKRV